MQVRTPRITFLAAGVPALLGRADHDERIHFSHRKQEHRAFITDRTVEFMSQQARTSRATVHLVLYREVPNYNTGAFLYYR